MALPASLDELRDLVRAAHDRRIRLLPQGANTGLVGASTPTADGDVVVVSLDHLAGAVDVDDRSAMAVVGAGTRLSALNAAAAAVGLHLPVDLSADPSIGGMIATNTGGSRVMRYGPMRNHVLAVEAVAADADASVIGGSAALRKDSRGVDPAQYLVGSGGALAIISRAVVSLTPLPARTEVWWLVFDDAVDVPVAHAALAAARPGVLSAFEFVSGAALERTLGVEGAPPNPFGGFVPAAAALAEWQATSDGALEGIEDDVSRLFDRGLIRDGLRTDAAAWALRHRISDSLRAYGTVLGHDISTPAAAVMPARADAIAAIAELCPAVTVCDFGHVGDGGLHLNVVVPDGVEVDRAAVRARVDAVVERYGGSYSAEHGLGPLNADRWLATTPAAERRAIAGVKAALDPRGILGHPGHPYNLL